MDNVGPVDVTKVASGTSTAVSSGAVTTMNAADLLFAATASAGGVTKGDAAATATGSYRVTAPMSGSGAWVRQVAAFKAAGQ